MYHETWRSATDRKNVVASKPGTSFLGTEVMCEQAPPHVQYVDLQEIMKSIEIQRQEQEQSNAAGRPLLQTCQGEEPCHEHTEPSCSKGEFAFGDYSRLTCHHGKFKFRWHAFLLF